MNNTGKIKSQNFHKIIDIAIENIGKIAKDDSG